MTNEKIEKANREREHRQDVLDRVNRERILQDHQWGGPDHDDKHARCDWIRFIVRQLGDADRALERNDVDEYHRQMVQVAALAVAAIQAHERKTGAVSYDSSSGRV